MTSTKRKTLCAKGALARDSTLFKVSSIKAIFFSLAVPIYLYIIDFLRFCIFSRGLEYFCLNLLSQLDCLANFIFFLPLERNVNKKEIRRFFFSLINIRHWFCIYTTSKQALIIAYQQKNPHCFYGFAFF